MLPYLTPQRYRSMGFGTDDEIEDEALLSIINRASLSVDRYCSVPMVPSRYSFRGGAVVQEEHDYRVGDGISDKPSHVFWPRSTPLLAVSDMKLYVTNTQFIDFAIANLFVTKDSINITSLTLTSAGIFGALAVPVIGLVTPILKMDYTYGYDFDSVLEQVERTDGKTFRAQNQFWNADVPIVTGDGTPLVTDVGYTVNKTEGTIEFTTAQAAGTVVELSYGYTMPNEVPQAVGYTVADIIGRKELQEKGLSGLQSIRVGEIALERPRPRANTSNQATDIPNEAKQLLEGLNFMTIQ